MSIPHVEESTPVISRGQDQARRRRLLGLVTRIEDDRLDVAEELLSDIVEHQSTGTRSLTEAELSALSRFGVDEESLSRPPALSATAKGLLWERQMGRHSYSVTEAARILGVTPARVRQRCAAGTLLAQRRSDGWHLPGFQFPDEREPRGWSVVAAAIPLGAPLLIVERVLTSPSPRLRAEGEDLAPLEWLAQGGEPEEAAAAVDDALNRLP